MPFALRLESNFSLIEIELAPIVCAFQNMQINNPKTISIKKGPSQAMGLSVILSY